MKAEFLDYRDLPGQNPIFLRYLYGFDEVRAWYPAGPLDPDILKHRARRLLARRYPREALALLLGEFNREVGASPQVFDNIRRLAESNTVAVLTGQQVGLFGGPALSVYKAMTAIRVAEMLRAEGVSAVPVFWLASDDSDYHEVASTTWLDDAGRLLQVELPSPENPNQMAGTVRLDGIGPVFADLRERAIRGPFRDAVLQDLEGAYGPGRTFRHAFGVWLAHLFAEQGLILHDALSVGAKRLVSEKFATAVRSRDEIVKVALTRAGEIEARGLAAQVRVGDEESFLFSLNGDERYKLEYQKGRYIIRDGAAELDPTLVLSDIATHPERFSPNVLLRPIIQDCLFPTVTYVGGPAELAYFAQVTAIAPFWGVEPAVMPRVGATVVDPKVQRLLGKYRIRLTDIVGSSPDVTLRRLAREGAAGNLISRFDALKASLQAETSAIGDEIRPIDPTVGDMFGRSRSKMLYQLNKVQDRFIRNYAVQASDLERQVTFLHNSLYPTQALQERVLNFNQFLMLLSPAVVADILESIQPFCKEHHVLYVSTS